MKPIFTSIVILVLLVIACGQSTDQIGTLVAPTEEAAATSTSDEESVPTDGAPPTDTAVPTVSPTPSPTITPTPEIEGLIKPGMYLVGPEDDQIMPGIYVGKGSSCYWERLSGLGGTFDDIIANAGVDGQFYVEIKDTDTAFSISRCSILPLDKVPAPSEPFSSVEPGMYLIGRDVEAGIYQGTGESCYWERLSGLSGSFDDIIANDGPDGQFYVEVKETDVAINLNRCSIMHLDQIPAPTEFETHLEPGMYLVGRDIEAGIYQGTGESCYWERLKNVSGGFDAIIANDGPNGNFLVEIAPTDFAFRVNRCSVDKLN